MKLIDQAALGFLRLDQSEIGPDFTNEYDLLLTVLGWETRALQNLKIFGRCSGTVVALRFASDRDEINEKKDRVQDKFQQYLSPRMELVQLDGSHQFRQNCAKLEDCLMNFSQSLGKPMRVLVDASCFPKRYLLYILGSGFRNELINCFDFLYSEGRYDIQSFAAQSTTSSAGLISNGDWSSLQIPYMEGRSYTPGKRDLFISLGAEISAAVPIVDRFEPTKLVLFPVANNKQLMDSTVLAAETNALRRLEGLPNAQSEPFALNDVVGLASKICELVHTPTTCLSIGSKPHALALGVASLANDAIEVVCRVPSSYSGIDVAPTGRVFKFAVEDRFDPFTYLGKR